MKKIYSFLVAAVLSITTAQAQQAVAVLTHDGTSKTFNGFHALQEAYAEAASGDLITLSSGTFGAVTTIEKAVKIRGAGMEVDTIYNTLPTIIDGNMTLAIQNEMTSFQLEGIFHANTIYYKFVQYKPQFTKCRLTNIFIASHTEQGTTYSGRVIDANFFHCKIMNRVNLSEESSMTFVNCFVGTPHTYNDSTSVFTFYNCVLEHLGNTSGDLSIHGSTLYNTILCSNSIGYNYKTSFINCLLYQLRPDESRNTYKVFNTRAEVFKTYTDTYKLSDKENFETYPEYSTYGIYSGSFPYSPRVSGPHIQLMEVAPRSSDTGTLNVRIKVQNTTN